MRTTITPSSQFSTQNIVAGTPPPMLMAKPMREHEYVSKMLIARPGNGEIEATYRYYRMKFESRSASVISISSETIETVCDPDTAVRAIFYVVHVNYRAAVAFKLNSMD